MIDVIFSWDFLIFLTGLGVVALLCLVCAAVADRVTVSCRCGLCTVRDARFVDPVDADLARESLTARCPVCVQADAKRMFDGSKRPIKKTMLRWGRNGYHKHHQLGPPAPTTEITA